MLKKILFFILFLLAVSILLYFAYNDPSGIAFSIFGFAVETSLYLIGAVLLIIFKVAQYLSSIFNIFKFIFSFFSGRSKERAEKALLNAYAAILSGRPVQARKYLKKCEKYYGDNPHPAFIKLMADKVIGDKEVSAEALSVVEKSADMKTLTPFVRSLYENDQQEKLRYTEKAQSFKESQEALTDYIALALQQGEYNHAYKAVKKSQSVLKDYNKHFEAIQLVLSHKKALAKDPESSLDYAQSALKKGDNVIAFLLAQSAFKKLMRENKSTRLIHDRFRSKPDFVSVKAFLDMRSLEEEEKMAKRISALPRENEKDNAFLALQAYHFAKYRDFHSLAIAVRYVEQDQDNDWSPIALLCLAIEKDDALYEQALGLFLDMINATAYQELYDAAFELPELYREDLLLAIKPYCSKSLDVVKHQISLFQNMIKHIPLSGSYNTVYKTNSQISQDDVKQLYNGDFKDDEEEA